MAKLFPEIPANEWKKYWTTSDNKRLHSEETCYKSFSELPDGWTVIHTTGWQDKTGEFQADGEIDFILVHVSKGVFFCEVKGGLIRIKDGVWFQASKFGKDAGKERKLRKTPFEQAMKSKRAIDSFLSENLPKSSQKDNPIIKYLGHFIALPGVEVEDEPLGADGPRVLCLDSKDLEVSTERMQAIADHYELQPPGESLATKIIKLLVPTREFKASRTRFRGEDIEIIKEAIQTLTQNQFETLESLKENKQALISGTAGTGKTVLATEKAQQLADLGFKTLFVCYNKPLSMEIEKKLSSSKAAVKTFHQLCFDVIEEAKRKSEKKDKEDKSDEGLWSEVDDEENKKHDIFWEETLPIHLQLAAEIVGTKYDAIVIDEGQDFMELWLKTLQEMLDEDEGGHFYIFSDEDQNIFNRTNNLKNSHFAKFSLRQNIRNTEQISNKVRNIFGHEKSLLEGIDGIEPIFYETANDDQISQKLMKKIEDILKDPSISEDQIIILCDETKRRERFANDTKSIARLKGTAIETSSIKRFKGLEEDIVFLVLPSNPPDTEYLRKHAYVGMSRAIASLHVFGTIEDKDVLNWDKE